VIGLSTKFAHRGTAGASSNDETDRVGGLRPVGKDESPLLMVVGEVGVRGEHATFAPTPSRWQATNTRTSETSERRDTMAPSAPRHVCAMQATGGAAITLIESAARPR
jgi:hypothetical protein